jgi:hypothetical protein
MKNFIVQIPATIDLEVQAESRYNLLPEVKEALADFGYAVNLDLDNLKIESEWNLKPQH